MHVHMHNKVDNLNFCKPLNVAFRFCNFSYFWR